MRLLYAFSRPFQAGGIKIKKLWLWTWDYLCKDDLTTGAPSDEFRLSFLSTAIDTVVAVKLDPPQLQTAIGSTYKCDVRKDYTIDHNVNISFINIEYKAFNADNNTSFDQSK